MSFQVSVERPALKSLSRIPSPHRERIVEAIEALSSNPRPSGVKKLSGRDAWRIRIGTYRVLYEIDDRERKVNVVVVGTRQNVYE